MKIEEETGLIFLLYHFLLYSWTKENSLSRYRGTTAIYHAHSHLGASTEPEPKSGFREAVIGLTCHPGLRGFRSLGPPWENHKYWLKVVVACPSSPPADGAMLRSSVTQHHSFTTHRWWLAQWGHYYILRLVIICSYKQYPNLGSAT